MHFFPTLSSPTTRKNRLLTTGIMAAFALAAMPAQAQLVAFPGAEGYGRFATGGRGGQVVEVTNLNDSGAGSFRDAFNQFPGQPLTIVFRVGGVIDLKTAIRPSRSNVTIAGQTAPGDGICLKRSTFKLFGNNIIVRYIRSRPGDIQGSNSPAVYGMNMENCKNFIVDHCSLSWAIEEVGTFYDNKYSTVQWSIFSESLNSSFNGKGDHGYAGVWGGQYSSYHHNLVAHHHSRTIRFNGSRAHDTTAIVDYRNNVIYNWGNNNAAYGNEVEINGGSGQLNLVNNYYKAGPATPASRAKLIFDNTNAYDAANPNKPFATVYANGNYVNNYPAVTADNWNGGIVARYYPVAALLQFKQAAPTAGLAPITTQTAEDAYLAVLENAGATLPKRDVVDARIVNETRTGTATGSSPGGSDTYGLNQGIIDTQEAVGGWPLYNNGTAPTDTDHDGMPDTWEVNNSLNPNDPTDRNNLSSTGYTMLETYLNSLVPTTVLANRSRAEQLSVKVYPNPTQKSLTVTHPAFKGTTNITLYTFEGRRVTVVAVQPGTTSTQLTLPTLAAGHYLVRLTNGQETLSTTFIKQ
ncbi:T9SS type A sorting domain-containing protein [Hymenobacter sp. GOD-10R]|uniref:T9SS type A sorting domain-containing protein n=1 Tax=Hymenobacter sp. GOD-10R TaxID=3093922 RepID=UPI002D79A22C|nr:T9SS type A sorting domain-containing protein [Hymenobacter sp. GOD-10R]WRQ26160.1 T9SS type A sorting domain-containing protein [Hymenobacter sp. GOD-10R]